jgi:hypothetical protein
MIQSSLSSIHIFLISRVHSLKVRYSSKHGIAFQYENLELPVVGVQMKCGFKTCVGSAFDFFNYHQFQVPSSDIQNQGASSGCLKN